jgi:ATP-dependent RNA helicase
MEKDSKAEEYFSESFESMALPENLLKSIYSYGFERPSDIQKKAIGCIVSGRDLIAQAPSGTGKTGAFSIGSCANMDPELDELQTVILSPTRELAKQTYNVLFGLSNYMNLKVSLGTGGQQKSKFVMEKKRKDQVIIGTPGRICDNLEHNEIDFSHLKMLILDEADEMLSIGFVEQIKKIFRHIREETQIILFSATIPREMLEITNYFMEKPLTILMNPDELTVKGIKQCYIDVQNDDEKFEIIKDLYGKISINQSIIFCNTKKKVIWLEQKLTEDKCAVSIIHGDMLQEERNSIMEDFRSGGCRILIATDVLSRGIDVQQVSLVINFDMTREMETYLHRIGRCGRHGRKGVAINLVNKFDQKYLRAIERHYNITIDYLDENFEKDMMNM